MLILNSQETFIFNILNIYTAEHLRDQQSETAITNTELIYNRVWLHGEGLAEFGVTLSKDFIKTVRQSKLYSN